MIEMIYIINIKDFFAKYKLWFLITIIFFIIFRGFFRDITKKSNSPKPDYMLGFNQNNICSFYLDVKRIEVGNQLFDLTFYKLNGNIWRT